MLDVFFFVKLLDCILYCDTNDLKIGRDAYLLSVQSINNFMYDGTRTGVEGLSSEHRENTKNGGSSSSPSLHRPRGKKVLARVL